MYFPFSSLFVPIILWIPKICNTLDWNTVKLELGSKKLPVIKKQKMIVSFFGPTYFRLLIALLL
jgi:hypothetical protein